MVTEANFLHCRVDCHVRRGDIMISQGGRGGSNSEKNAVSHENLSIDCYEKL